MARISGKNGQLKVGGVTVASISAWTLDAKVPVMDATAMMDAFKLNLSGIREWAATVEGRWESGGANTDIWDSFDTATTSGGSQSGLITVELYPDAATTEKWSGDAFADFTIKTGHDKVVEFTGKLTGTGSLTRTP